jgi:dTDP-4-dehydrorhamnose reductase
MPRILVTGASGLLGINFAQETMPEHEVIGVDRGKLIHAPFRILKKDLLEAGAVDFILDAVKPDWLINCAALADLDTCEENPDLARRLNTDLPRQLARACKARNVPLFTFQPTQSSTVKRTASTPKKIRPIRLGYIPKPSWQGSGRC